MCILKVHMTYPVFSDIIPISTILFSRPSGETSIYCIMTQANSAQLEIREKIEEIHLLSELSVVNENLMNQCREMQSFTEVEWLVDRGTLDCYLVGTVNVD